MTHNKRVTLKADDMRAASLVVKIDRDGMNVVRMARPGGAGPPRPVVIVPPRPVVPAPVRPIVAGRSGRPGGAGAGPSSKASIARRAAAV